MHVSVHNRGVKIHHDNASWCKKYYHLYFRNVWYQHSINYASTVALFVHFVYNIQPLFIVIIFIYFMVFSIKWSQQLHCQCHRTSFSVPSYFILFGHGLMILIPWVYILDIYLYYYSVWKSIGSTHFYANMSRQQFKEKVTSLMDVYRT